MNKATSFGMLAAIVFAVGMTGINLSDDTFAMHSNTATANTAGADILGHIELIQTDSEGNILSYQQTDNAIMNEGRNCTATLLFGVNDTSANTDKCGAFSNGNIGHYRVIAIGNGTILSTDNRQTLFTSEMNSTSNVEGMDRAIGTATFTASASGTTGDTADVRIQKQFTYTGSQAGNSIKVAGLFNSTDLASDSLFALKEFPSAVSMNNGDQLTVNWDISIAGSDATS